MLFLSASGCHGFEEFVVTVMSFDFSVISSPQFSVVHTYVASDGVFSNLLLSLLFVCMHADRHISFLTPQFP